MNISCDQISKNIVRNTIDKNQRIEVFNDNLILTKVENTGAAYSIGSELPYTLKIILLQALPLLVLFFLLFKIIKETEYSKETIIGITFIVGGGIGNIYDRIIYRSVTDFLIMDLGFIKTEVFNMADVSVMIGSFIIMTSVLLNRKGSFFKH
ncbi:signal peptidase II [Aquimarina addita]|uniref:Lipoprotein signal peptidase n=2 Tax=Aquimarina addita TaxID=870485 RepID=A0ABP6UP25_9FLAO